MSTRRTLKRLRGCGEDIQLGCNYQQMKPRDVVLSMFQKIDSKYDLIVVQSYKVIDRLNTSYQSMEF